MPPKESPVGRTDVHKSRTRKFPTWGVCTGHRSPYVPDVPTNLAPLFAAVAQVHDGFNPLHLVILGVVGLVVAVIWVGVAAARRRQEPIDESPTDPANHPTRRGEPRP